LKTAPSIAASLVVLALFASPALAAPTASFDVSAGPYRSGVAVTFTSTSTTPALTNITEQKWDFGDGTTDTGASVTHEYQTAGTYNVTLTVTNSELVDNTATSPPQTLDVATRPPTVDFNFAPGSPLVGDDVLFAPDASDPDGDSLSFGWNFGDGTPNAAQRSPIHRFTEAGTYTVTVIVGDGHGAFAAESKEITVRGILVPGNALPVARFAFSPRSAQVGEPVEFISSSYDPDGGLDSQTWDLDGDGDFDDARGDDVLYTFTSPGTKKVRLKVVDSSGASQISEREITVAQPPAPPPGFLRPDPKVRINGLILSNGMRVRVLSARAPRGALVTVRCKGKGCPVKQRRKRIKKGTVRFKTYERFLRGGVKLEVFVSKPGKIGDYTGYTIRRGKAPKIIDRCVRGTKLRPVKC
jgi:PKD repeat protein